MACMTLVADKVLGSDQLNAFQLALVLLLDNVKMMLSLFSLPLKLVIAMICSSLKRNLSRMYYIILILFKRFRLIITDAPEMAPLTTW